METLLKYGAETAQSEALQVAAARGNDKILELLIDHRADVNERLEVESINRGPKDVLASWVPLHFAAEQGSTAAVEKLLSCGADPNVEDIKGRTPQDLAASKGVKWPGS